MTQAHTISRIKGNKAKKYMRSPGRTWTDEKSVGDELQDYTLTLYKPHAGQIPLHQSTARFRIATCGRRFGKTWAAVNEIAKNAWENPKAVTWWVAPTYNLTQVGFRLLTRAFKRCLTDVSLSEKRVEWLSGAVTQFRSSENWSTLVGEGLKFLVVDEAGRVDERAWTESLRPTLADQHGRVLIIGTPKGKNWFYNEWTRGQDPKYTEYESWRFPTSANPYIATMEIEQARRTLPSNVFEQEWLAKFLDRNAGVFRGVDGCIREYDSFPEGPVDGGEYFGGLDLARLQDFTVLAILDRNRRVVYFDRWQHTSWEVQIQRVIDVAQRYKAMIMVDSSGVGDPIYERLERAGLDVEPFKFTNESKKLLVENLSLAIERNQITYPDIPELINELDIFEYDMSPTGLVRYNAPPGYHDDAVVGLALANWALERCPPGEIATWL